MPSFKLYSSDGEIDVSILLVDEKFRFATEKQFDLLKSLQTLLFNELLNLDLELNVESTTDSFWGCLTVLLNERDEIDWNFLLDESNARTRNLYELLRAKKDENIFDQNFAARVMLDEAKKNCLYKVKSIDFTKSPATLTDFKSSKNKSFREYFKSKYEKETVNEDQPMVELERIRGVRLMHLNRKKKSKSDNPQPSDYAELYISEHVYLLPFNLNIMRRVELMPSIYYRMNTILRARKLCLILENYIALKLNINVKFIYLYYFFIFWNQYTFLFFS